MKNSLLLLFKRTNSLLFNYGLVVFYIVTFIYFELIYRMWNYHNLSADFLFPILFAISAAFLFYVLTSIFPVRFQKYITGLFIFLITISYCLQLVYFQMFRVPLYLYSIGGATAALEFRDMILTNVSNNWLALLLLFIPLIALFLPFIRLRYTKLKKLPLLYTFSITVATYLIALLCISLTGNTPNSQRTQYQEMTSLETAIGKLGLMTAMRLDLKQMIFGGNDNAIHTGRAKIVSIHETYKVNLSTKIEYPKPTTDATTQATTEAEPPKPLPYNIMNIDFGALIANETDETLLEMDQYFSAIMPTQQNAYTGMFKGYNLIFLTSEAFSSYAIDEKLTPTLYKLSHNGFVFENFFNPVWGVSTSDGEYVACTGLIPKSGVWSFSRSSNNALPFVMGNQFRKIGYPTYAYHNHTYTYYDRDLSHPNMGYDYKGVGNGLDIKKSWPESDLEMIDVTSPEFISKEPFHTYFMTVSGHMLYSFSDNYIASKNKDLVKDLPYTEASRAYLACNIELDRAMALLIKNLETAGVLDKTVIVMSADHYPYGLPKESLDELAGHEVESNFELYKSSLIIWNNKMKPVVIDKPSSSLDIIPTISNLFGLEFDSRLLMGRDILSDEAPLVIFSNRSWITDRALYNTTDNTVAFLDGTENDDDYIKALNKIVNDKFKYSAKILEKDYYGKILPQE